MQKKWLLLEGIYLSRRSKGSPCFPALTAWLSRAEFCWRRIEAYIQWPRQWPVPWRLWCTTRTIGSCLATRTRRERWCVISDISQDMLAPSRAFYSYVEFNGYWVSIFTYVRYLLHLVRVLSDSRFSLFISSWWKYGLEKIIIGKGIQVGLLFFRGLLPIIIDNSMRTTDRFCSNSLIWKFSSNFLPTGMDGY